jgi:hypothetical protein
MYVEQRGSTIHLLKANTKPVSKRAVRKQYDLFEYKAP